jgi:hypothetical protein
MWSFMQDRELALRIVEYLNDLLERDRPAVAALIANRVPCRAALADHPTCQVRSQHGGFHVGMLGVLNGLCGVDELATGPIVAVFDDPEDEGDNVGGLLELMNFKVVEPLVSST